MFPSAFNTLFTFLTGHDTFIPVSFSFVETPLKLLLGDNVPALIEKPLKKERSALIR